jgi:hypothetical protein
MMRASTALFVVFALALAGGCVADADSGDDGGTGNGAHGNGTGDDVQCGTSPVVFPEFDKSCGNDDDCALVFHTIDCCGTGEAWGINEGEVEAFEAAEAICDSQYPGCGCPAGPTEAEDGNTGMSPGDFAVRCNGGTCMSYVP